MALDPHHLVEVLDEDPATLDRERRRQGLRTVAQLRAWISGREALFIQADTDDEDQDPSDPAKDTAGRLERAQRLEAGKAKQKTRTAQQLKALPATQNALENGTVSEAHAQVLADARSKADPKARAALEANEKRLLTLGSCETATEFRLRVARFVKAHSDDDGRNDHDRKNRQQRLSIWKDNDGLTQLRGTFGPEAGQRITDTLGGIGEELFRRDHRDHPDPDPVPGPERTNEHRLAEALDLLCRRHRADQSGTPSNADTAVVILSYEDLVEKLSTNGISATLADGTPIPASAARRLACDAGIIPLVLGGDSIPLDLGRKRRDASPGQKLSLKALWSTCSFADCRAPFDWCDIHHITPFNDGGRFGPTDIANLTPVCDHCHDLAHHPHWDLVKEPDGTVVTTAPDGTTWRRRPNRLHPHERPPQPPPAAPPDPPVDTDPAATLFTAAV